MCKDSNNSREMKGSIFVGLVKLVDELRSATRWLYKSKYQSEKMRAKTMEDTAAVETKVQFGTAFTLSHEEALDKLYLVVGKSPGVI